MQTLAALLASSVLQTADLPPPPPTSSVDVTAHLGAVGGDGFGGALFGASALARSGLLAGGVAADVGGMFATRLGAGALGGFSYRHDNGFGFDLLGVLGVHHYEGIGRGILSDNPGVGGTLPFAGARSRLSYQIGRRAVRFQFGGTAMIDMDLGRMRKTSTYSSTGWFSGTTETRSDTRTVGFGSVGVTLDAGVTFL